MSAPQEMRRLGQDIITAYDRRFQEVARLRSEVSAERQGFREAHKSMAREQRQRLTQGRARLASQVSALLQGLTQGSAQRRKEVLALRQGFQEDHQGMAKEQRQRLSQVRPQLHSQVAGMLHHFAQGGAQLRSQVSSQRRGFQQFLRGLAQERAGGQEEWRRALRTLVARRKRPELGEEEAVARAQPEAGPEATALAAQVFEHLANHPDGTRLAELEEHFGLPRLSMARVVRRLMEDNRLEKRGLLYFAI